MRILAEVKKVNDRFVHLKVVNAFPFKPKNFKIAKFLKLTRDKFPEDTKVGDLIFMEEDESWEILLGERIDDFTFLETSKCLDPLTGLECVSFGNDEICVIFNPESFGFIRKVIFPSLRKTLDGKWNIYGEDFIFDLICFGIDGENLIKVKQTPQVEDKSVLFKKKIKGLLLEYVVDFSLPQSKNFKTSLKVKNLSKKVNLVSPFYLVLFPKTFNNQYLRPFLILSDGERIVYGSRVRYGRFQSYEYTELMENKVSFISERGLLFELCFSSPPEPLEIQLFANSYGIFWYAPSKSLKNEEEICLELVFRSFV